MLAELAQVTGAAGLPGTVELGVVVAVVVAAFKLVDGLVSKVLPARDKQEPGKCALRDGDHRASIELAHVLKRQEDATAALQRCAVALEALQEAKGKG